MDPLPGSVLAGRYRVVRTLGQGGMGTVLEVVHDGLGERYALKLLHTEASRDAEALARFANEARIAARLRSEHLV
ncbi:MAG: serine/threonine protein kinase, partial [Myxococcales bacterium]|nr:serine/threonine protein kinase [Myxococcales bacterium]